LQEQNADLHNLYRKNARPKTPLVSGIVKNLREVSGLRFCYDGSEETEGKTDGEAKDFLRTGRDL
jgi:hypothetical protein